MIIAGCDCGKDSLHVCVLESIPENLKKFSRSYKPTVVKANAEGIETLLSIDADAYAIEPTGHYSRIWVNHIKQAGKRVLLVSPRKVRHFCEYQGMINKADRPDAAAIAAYALENIHKDAFLRGEREDIKDLYLQLNSITKAKNPVVNQIGQRLGFEFPEMLKTYEGSKRKWLEPEPPNLYRWLAGEETFGGKKKDEKLANTIGEGLSIHTRGLASQLCQFERQEYDLERLLQEQLDKACYQPYHEVFNQFLIPPRIRCCLLSRIYPFDKEFLVNGRPVKEYVSGPNSKRKSGMTKRDRSEGEFKLCLGMGKELKQSGGEWKWKASGCKYARTAIWLYVRRVIVISKGKGFADILKPIVEALAKPGVSPWLNVEIVEAIANLKEIPIPVASLMVHYEMQTTKGDQRIQATASRFCRMLYKEMVKKFGRIDSEVTNSKDMYQLKSQIEHALGNLCPLD